jgi:mycothiol synthase
LPEPLLRRPATPADAAAVLALMIRCDLAELGEPDSDLADVEHVFGQLNLAEDSFLWWDGAGQLVGYGAVLPQGENFALEFNRDPAWPDGQLTATILAQLLTRAQAIVDTRGSEARAGTIAPHANVRDVAAIQAAGFAADRIYYQFRIQLAEPPPVVTWPAGYLLRTFAPAQDSPATHALVEAAFAQPGRTPNNLESWQAHMLRPGSYDPALFFLLEKAGQLAGACLCFEYDSGGWVRQLAVAPSAQGQGLGGLLLAHAFHVFYQRGHRAAGLATDSSRPDAQRFYRRAGMAVRVQYDSFALTLTPTVG